MVGKFRGFPGSFEYAWNSLFVGVTSSFVFSVPDC